MPYTINVTYKLPLTAVQNEVSPISPVFDGFTKNYASDPSYTEANGNTIWNTKVVRDRDVTTTRETSESAKSIYATSSLEWGSQLDPEIYAHTSVSNPIPLYKFAKEVFPISTYDSGTDTYSAELVVKDESEINYYESIGKALGTQNVTVNITPTVLFDRYTTVSDLLMEDIANMVYIPTFKELKYFEDTDNSDETDPQPLDIESVTIDTTNGVVYNATALDTDNYIVKTDSIVIVYHKPLDVEEMNFTYNGVKFDSTDADPSKLPYGIQGRGSDGAWVCSEDSIMIDTTNNVVFIGNNVYIPQDTTYGLPNGDIVFY